MSDPSELEPSELAQLRALLATDDVQVDAERREAAIQAALDASTPAVVELHPPLRSATRTSPWRGVAVAATVVAVFGGLVAVFATSGTSNSGEEASTDAVEQTTADSSAAADDADSADSAGSAEMAPPEADADTSPDAPSADDAQPSTTALAGTSEADGRASEGTSSRFAGIDTTLVIDLGTFDDAATLRARAATLAEADPGTTDTAVLDPTGACAARVLGLGARALATANVAGADVLVVDAGGDLVLLVGADCAGVLE
jgi:hypothetical protein